MTIYYIFYQGYEEGHVVIAFADEEDAKLYILALSANTGVPVAKDRDFPSMNSYCIRPLLVHSESLKVGELIKLAKEERETL